LNASSGIFSVDVSVHHRHLVMTVSDQGTWLATPSTNQDRGRGIAIMQSVSERFTRTSDANGTTVEMVFAKSELSS
jgi:anti-sigma regulatory factor (Ser/Thr protein kinase)